MELPLVISLCDYTGNSVQPWAKGGYECWIVDLRHTNGVGELHGGIRKIGIDITKFQLPNRKIAFISAFPPCTDLAASGSRHFQSKGLDSLIVALYNVSCCIKLCEASNAPYLIENPVGVLSTFWRKPDHTFDPYEYAGYAEDPISEGYSKKTCLWTNSKFVMPPKRPTTAHMGSKMHFISPSWDRQHKRSESPKGFSNAVFEYNRFVAKG